MIVSVTEEHIKNGEPKSFSGCPIALACKELFPNCDIDVDLESIGVYPNNERYDFLMTPKKAQNFIKKFDDGEKVKPFSFRVRKPKIKEKKCE